MKHILFAALVTLAPAAALADQPQAMSDAELGMVAGQASFSLSSLALPPEQAAKIITGLQQASTTLNKFAPLLGSNGKSLATVVTSAATIAPIANKIVNGEKATAAELSTVLKSGTAGVSALSKLFGSL